MKSGVTYDGRGRFTIHIASLAGEGTALEREVLGSSIEYEKAKIQIDDQNAEQLLRDASSALNIDLATLQSLSEERRVEYIAEKLVAKLDETPNREKIKYDSKERQGVLHEAYIAHGVIKEIFERNLVEDPLIVEERRLESEKRKESILSDLLVSEGKKDSLFEPEETTLKPSPERVDDIEKRNAEKPSPESVEDIEKRNAELFGEGQITSDSKYKSEFEISRDKIVQDTHILESQIELESKYKQEKAYDQEFEADLKSKITQWRDEGIEQKEIIEKMWKEWKSIDSNKGSVVSTQHLCILLSEKIESDRDADITGITLNTGQKKWEINYVANVDLGISNNGIMALKQLPQKEQLEIIEEIGKSIEFNKLGDEGEYRAYLLLKEAAQEGILIPNSEEYNNIYSGQYSREERIAADAVIQEAIVGLNLQDQEKRILGSDALDERWKLEIVASEAGKVLGIDLSEENKLQEFKELDQAKQLEKIDNAVKEKDLNADNAEITYQAYKALRRITEQNKEDHRVVDIPQDKDSIVSKSKPAEREKVDDKDSPL